MEWVGQIRRVDVQIWPAYFVDYEKALWKAGQNNLGSWLSLILVITVYSGNITLILFYCLPYESKLLKPGSLGTIAQITSL